MLTSNMSENWELCVVWWCLIKTWTLVELIIHSEVIIEWKIFVQAGESKRDGNGDDHFDVISFNEFSHA